MRLRPLIKVVCTAAAQIVAAAVIAAAQPPLELGWKADPGLTRTVIFAVSMTVDSRAQILEAGDASGLQAHEIPGPRDGYAEAEWIMTETAAPDGRGLAITYRLHALRARLDLGPVSLEFDSTNPADQGKKASPPIRDLAHMLGAEWVVRLGADGAVRSVEAPVMDPAERAAQIEDPTMAPAAAAQMELLWSQSNIAGVIADALSFLPPGPAAVGDSWSAASSVAMPFFGPAPAQTRLSLLGVEPCGEGECARIAYERSIQSGDARSTPPVHARLEQLDYAAEGVVLFDIDAGRVHSAQQQTRIRIDLTFLDPLEGDQPLGTLEHHLSLESRFGPAK